MILPQAYQSTGLPLQRPAVTQALVIVPVSLCLDKDAQLFFGIAVMTFLSLSMSGISCMHVYH
jgi:hypothetical protein